MKVQKRLYEEGFVDFLYPDNRSVLIDRDSISREDYYFKRILDILCSIFLMVVFFPLFVVIAIMVKADSKGTVFFIQKRCGRYGRKFNMCKFRTMVQDAESLKQGLKSETDGPMFKMRKDPRVTRVGRFLRSWSLDELPQLLNVLRGEMSLVGPRPLSSKEMTRDYNWKRIRLSVKPGLTGLWQIRGRGSNKFIDWVKFDIEYVRKKSFIVDVKILFSTINAVIMNAGTY